MTEPKEIAASVERVERQEPPEPEGWIALIWDSCSWEVDTRYVIYSRDGALFNCRAAGDIRLVRIGGQPQPSATPATANLPVGDLVNVLRACEMHRTELEQGLDHNATILARGYRKSETEVRSWLAGQPQPEQPSAAEQLHEQDFPTWEIDQLYHELLHAVVCKFPGETRHETALRYIKERESREVATPTPPASAKVERKVPVEAIRRVNNIVRALRYVGLTTDSAKMDGDFIEEIDRWLAEQEG